MSVQSQTALAHDSLSIRIATILRYFLSGERRSLKDLAEEFNVSLRTLQRDIYERLGFLPIERDESGKYYLQEEALGKLGFKDLREFARLSGLSGLYPSLEDSFLSDLLHFGKESLLIKNGGFENIANARLEFVELSRAVLKRFFVRFEYKGKSRVVAPYRLVNNQGIWYLLGEENGTLKHFAFSHIKQILVHKSHFTPQEKTLNLIAKTEHTWVSQNLKTAIISVAERAREYFTRKKFISCSILESSDPALLEALDSQMLSMAQNGECFFVRAEYSYDDEVLNLAKMFLPHIRILQPKSLQEALESTLRAYLQA